MTHWFFWFFFPLSPLHFLMFCFCCQRMQQPPRWTGSGKNCQEWLPAPQPSIRLWLGLAQPIGGGLIRPGVSSPGLVDLVADFPSCRRWPHFLSVTWAPARPKKIKRDSSICNNHRQNETKNILSWPCRAGRYSWKMYSRYKYFKIVYIANFFYFLTKWK